MDEKAMKLPNVSIIFLLAIMVQINNDKSTEAIATIRLKLLWYTQVNSKKPLPVPSVQTVCSEKSKLL